MANLFKEKKIISWQIYIQTKKKQLLFDKPSKLNARIYLRKRKITFWQVYLNKKKKRIKRKITF